MFDILAIGELNVDLIMAGMRQLPVNGHEILATRHCFCMGSSTAITACTASSLGCTVAFCGLLGMDYYGDLVISYLNSYGVDCHRIKRSKKYSTGITVSLSSHTDRALVTWPGDTISSLKMNDININLCSARHIHIGSYYLHTGLQEYLPKLFAELHEKGITTSIDTGWDPNEDWTGNLPAVLKYTDILFVNEDEATAISGIEDIKQAAFKISEYGCTTVIKCGSRGAIMCNRINRKTYQHSGFSTNVVDTTGAGDSFNGGYLYGFLNGFNQTDCLKYANACGAINVAYYGGSTQCPALPMVEKVIHVGHI